MIDKEPALRAAEIAHHQIVAPVPIHIAAAGDGAAEKLVRRVTRMQQDVVANKVRAVIDHHRAFVGITLDGGVIPRVHQVGIPVSVQVAGPNELAVAPDIEVVREVVSWAIEKEIELAHVERRIAHVRSPVPRDIAAGRRQRREPKPMPRLGQSAVPDIGLAVARVEVAGVGRAHEVGNGLIQNQLYGLGQVGYQRILIRDAKLKHGRQVAIPGLHRAVGERASRDLLRQGQSAEGQADAKPFAKALGFHSNSSEGIEQKPIFEAR